MTGLKGREMSSDHGAITTAAKEKGDQWEQLVFDGINSSISGLSEMVGQEVRVTSLDPRQQDAGKVHDLLGGPETVIAGVYLGIDGAASGQLLLAFEPTTAYRLIDMLMMQPEGTTIGISEMEESILGEMGNVMGAFFLTVLGDNTSGQFMPTPPLVINDMAGSVIDAILAHMMLEADDVMAVETKFGTDDMEIEGAFLVLPSNALVDIALEERSAA
jgi:chemotaxis protein CheC